MMFHQLTTDLSTMPAALMVSDIIRDVPIVQLFGPRDAGVAGISTDSRKIKDRWLFVAIEGEKADGHLFVQKAIEQGASCVVVQRKQYEVGLHQLLSASYAQHNQTMVIVVEDSRIAVALLADRYYHSPSSKLRMVGVTGTNGKTTSAYLLKSVFEADGEVVGLIGTIEYQIGKKSFPANFTTPPAEELHKILADMVSAGCTTVVMEVSSHALALKRVHGISFESTLFTNLTQDHLDFHGSMELYRDAKELLFSKYTKLFGIINKDDDAAKTMLSKLKKKGFSFGTTGKPTFKISDVVISGKGTRVTVEHDGAAVVIQSKLIGMFNAYNLVGAYAVGIVLGLKPAVVLRGLKKLSAVDGRFERLVSVDGIIAIVDYSHTPDALMKAICTARELVRPPSKIITVFGCGGDRDRDKRPLMGQAASSLSDLTILTSDNPRTEDADAIINDIAEGIVIGAPVIIEPDRKAAIRIALKSAERNDVVLIAGKGHETYQIIGTKKHHFDDREIISAYFNSHCGGIQV